MRKCKACSKPLKRRTGKNGEKYEGPSQFKRRECCNLDCYVALQRRQSEANKKQCNAPGCTNLISPARTYCSEKCTGAGHRANSLKKLKKDKPRHCKACGKLLELNESEQIWSFRARVTCGSRSCVAQYSWTKKRRRVPRKCKGCGKMHLMEKTRQQFHNHKCFFEWQRKQSYVIVTCTGCGKKFKRQRCYLSGSGRAFHSKECWREHTGKVKNKAPHTVSLDERRSILVAYAREGTKYGASLSLGVPKARIDRVVRDWEKELNLASRTAASGFVGRAYEGTPKSKKVHHRVILDFFAQQEFPKRLLTLPGPNMDFEKSALRQGCEEVVSVEKNPVLYEQSLLFLSPLQCGGEELTGEMSPCAKNGQIRVLNTDLVNLVSLEEEHPLFPWIWATYLQWDGVWLDFCGHLTSELTELLSLVAECSAPDARIAVTIMASRDKGYNSDEQRIASVHEAMGTTSEGSHRYISEKRVPMLTVFGRTASD